MRMRLEYNRTRSHYLSTLPALIARRTHLIKPTMGSRQGVCLRQRTLPSRLSGSVHVDDHPLLAHPIEQATRRGKRRAHKQILLKERSKGFHTGLIKSRKKAGQG